jgi:hypothetical protein
VTFTFEKNDKQVDIDAQKLNRYIASLPSGVYTIKIKKMYSQRTTRQNKYIHGVLVKMIAGHTGQDHDSVYDFLKSEFNSKSVIMNEKEIKMPQSIAELSTVDFEDVCRRARMWALEYLDLIIPEPNEKI